LRPPEIGTLEQDFGGACFVVPEHRWRSPAATPDDQQRETFHHSITTANTSICAPARRPFNNIARVLLVRFTKGGGDLTNIGGLESIRGGQHQPLTPATLQGATLANFKSASLPSNWPLQERRRSRMHQGNPLSLLPSHKSPHSALPVPGGGGSQPSIGNSRRTRKLRAGTFASQRSVPGSDQSNFQGWRLRRQIRDELNHPWYIYVQAQAAGESSATFADHLRSPGATRSPDTQAVTGDPKTLTGVAGRLNGGIPVALAQQIDAARVFFEDTSTHAQWSRSTVTLRRHRSAACTLEGSGLPGWRSASSSRWPEGPAVHAAPSKGTGEGGRSALPLLPNHMGLDQQANSSARVGLRVGIAGYCQGIREVARHSPVGAP